MQAEHHSGDECGDASDLRDFADENEFCVYHVVLLNGFPSRCNGGFTPPPSFCLTSSDAKPLLHLACISIAFWPGQVEDELLRIVTRQGAILVKHAGEFFDGALPDFFVFGAQQPVPNFGEIHLAVNLFDKLRGIVGKRILACRQLFFVLVLSAAREISTGCERGYSFVGKGRRRSSVRLAVRVCLRLQVCRTGRRGKRIGISAGVVRRSLAPEPVCAGWRWSPAPFPACRAGRRIRRALAVGAAIWPGMTVGFA